MTGRRFVSMLWIVLLLACGPAASDSADTGMTDTTVIPTPKTTLVMVFDTMGFTNAESETVAPSESSTLAVQAMRSSGMALLELSVTVSPVAKVVPLLVQV